ncbi:MAG: Reversal of tor2 lethality [Bogoriella megaspora]|nr:MAG: Reversal of tor2 lethality [Bogoriella megaspora]
MTPSLASAAIVALSFFTFAEGQGAKDLVGTWSSKANRTLTGEGFYDPVKDQFTEPSRTGISYSFTLDGHYEEAYYRAVPNPTNPDCPEGILQFQHGTYEKAANGSLLLTPIDVDGRQLISAPCNGNNAIYTKYNQSELIKSYEVLTDPFHKIPRLNLYMFDGAPLQPLYLAYSPPKMLPTTTLNPTTNATSSGAAATGTSTSSSKLKRWLGEDYEVDGMQSVIAQKQSGLVDANRWWWFGVGMTGLGSVLYFCL